MFSIELDQWPEIILGVAWLIMGLASLVAGLCLWRGPTTADRLVVVELVATIVVSAALLAVVGSGLEYPLDLALVVALVGFLGSSAVAGMLHRKGGDE